MILDNHDKAIIGELEKRELHPSELARLTKLPRTTIAYRLKRLSKHKAVSSRTDGRKVVWRRLFDSKNDLPIQIYSGENFYKTYLDCLKINPNSIILSVQGTDAAKHELINLPRTLVFDIHKYFKKNNIVFKSITNIRTVDLFNEIDKQYIQSHQGRAGGLKLLKDNSFTGDGEIAICEQFIIITNPKEKMGVVIKEPALVIILYQTLNLLLNSLDEIRGIDLNDHIKKILESR